MHGLPKQKQVDAAEEGENRDYTKKTVEGRPGPSQLVANRKKKRKNDAMGATRGLSYRD